MNRILALLCWIYATTCFAADPGFQYFDQTYVVPAGSLCASFEQGGATKAVMNRARWSPRRGDQADVCISVDGEISGRVVDRKGYIVCRLDGWTTDSCIQIGMNCAGQYRIGDTVCTVSGTAATLRILVEDTNGQN